MAYVMNNFIVFFLILISSITFSQSRITINEFLVEKDSLLQKRNKLSKEKKSLQKEIDSLKVYSNFLEEQKNKFEREIEELYIKNFGKEYGKRIYNKQVWKGMTEKMLLAGWGKPDRIDKNVQKWGTFTQWYYGKATFYFRDGKLIDFEEI